jgi:hypothetical protein
MSRLYPTQATDDTEGASARGEIAAQMWSRFDRAEL